METKTKVNLWAYGLLLIIVVTIAVIVAKNVTAKDYRQRIADKEIEIQRLQEEADSYDKKATYYREQSKMLAKEILKSSEKIKAFQARINRQKNAVVVPPKTTEETVTRLREAGLNPHVDCK